MIATANKKSVNKLAIRSLKANKMRNIFAIIAIALTTILFTSLFTISMSMVKSMERSTMRQVGGSDHGVFKNLTSKELNRIKKHDLIKQYGYSIIFSDVKNKELATRYTEMRYATNNAAKSMFSFPLKGHMPKTKNEIATDTIVLDMLHISHKLGEKIIIKYDLKGKQYSDTFVLSGYWKGDIVTQASMMWISKDFLQVRLGNNNQNGIKKRIKQGDYTGTIDLEVMFSNSFNIKEKILKVLNDSGYTPREIRYGVNWAYLTTQLDFDLETVLILIAAMTLIIFSGYLIIYNIFYISVAKDTKFYGMLKTIGTTSKQIKRIVKRQVSFLSIIGIPIGLIIGYILGSILVPFTVSMTGCTNTEISSSPIIGVGSALFSLITVLISCRKPAQIASKISPIEAIRYIDVSSKAKKKMKKSIKGAKVHKMAFNNIFRNKVRAIVVMISLSLSIILFTSVYTITTGFNMNKYISEMISSDFAVADAGYFSQSVVYEMCPKNLSEEVVHQISAFKGIKDVGRIYFQDMYNQELNSKALNWLKALAQKANESKNNNYYRDSIKIILKDKKIPIFLNGLDKFVWKKIKLVKGSFDAKRFATGNYIIIGPPDFPNPNISKSYYDVGETIKITYDDGTQKAYKVMAIGEVPYNLTARGGTEGRIEAYVPSEVFKVHIKKPIIMTAIFNIKKKYINYDNAYLANYIKTKQPMLGYKSKKVLENEVKDTEATYKLVGGSLSFIIALIGILNFVNSMATSIVSRKRENAMLQGIGMTDRQLYKMLIFEGLYYAIFTMLIAVTIGTALNYFIVNALVGDIWFFSYRFTLLPLAICAPILVVISVIVPIICYKASNGMSIVERLGEAE